MVRVTYLFITVRCRLKTPLLAINRSKLAVFKSYRVVVVLALPFFTSLSLELQTVERIDFLHGKIGSDTADTDAQQQYEKKHAMNRGNHATYLTSQEKFDQRRKMVKYDKYSQNLIALKLDDYPVQDETLKHLDWLPPDPVYNSTICYVEAFLIGFLRFKVQNY